MVRPRRLAYAPDGLDPAEPEGYAERGELRSVVDTVRPLADVAAAHRALEAGGVRGKHVIRVG
ncbi:zinc-binding dehydrogenase [Nocardiopsis potens]|uniref:zinc-binding dehydrogenase n=1 Tax=Nocardiopsis potens TaxID=1246458 RepID=UPI00034B7E5F